MLDLSLLLSECDLGQATQALGTLVSPPEVGGADVGKVR